MRMYMMRVETLLTPERHENEAEHVKRRHKSGTHPHQPPQHAETATFDRGAEDLVLTPEAGKGWYAGNGDGGQQHGFVGATNVVAQPTHMTHVLLLVHGVDDTASTEKEETLKEGMRHDMEEPRGERPHPTSQEHKPQLTHGRIGQDALDIVLYQANTRRKQGGEGANPSHNLHGHRRQHKERLAAHHHVHASRHHGGGVDEGTHGSRAFH